MLDVSAIGISSLAEALEDHSAETTWWLDSATGVIRPQSEGLSLIEEGEEDPEKRGWIFIEPVPSSAGYGDMEDFIARVRDPRAADLLGRAIRGRGAFRRFKDTILEFEDLRAAWFAFHDARMKRRALDWLREEGLVDPAAIEREIAKQPDPALPGIEGEFDAEAIARAVAADLKELYGERLREVILFGSWARGDAHPESDIDLLLVLSGPVDPYEEIYRTHEIIWRRSGESDSIVTVVPVSEEDYRAAASPLLMNVRAEGRGVA